MRGACARAGSVPQARIQEVRRQQTQIQLGDAGGDLGARHGALKMQRRRHAAAQVITRELRTINPCAHLEGLCLPVAVQIVQLVGSAACLGAYKGAAFIQSISTKPHHAVPQHSKPLRRDDWLSGTALRPAPVHVVPQPCVLSCSRVAVHQSAWHPHSYDGVAPRLADNDGAPETPLLRTELHVQLPAQ
eukprot:scaffold134760_cov72-Phaeocystis_antarctica.AAC.3